MKIECTVEELKEIAKILKEPTNDVSLDSSKISREALSMIKTINQDVP